MAAGGGATARFPMMTSRILGWGNYEMEVAGDPAMNMSDSIFGFLEENFEISPDSTTGSEGYRENIEEEEEDEEEEDLESIENNKSFWESQHQQLQATLYRTTTLESRIRNETKAALREAQLAGNVCTCRRPISGGCRDCLMKIICGRLQDSGYNSAICKSKWKNSPDIPSGEHTFLDVVDNSNPKKGEIRVVIELNFKGEFEMAKACNEYNRLVSALPEVFIGKIERLLALLKILCTAAKKCMKEKKMHLGPWRKHRYMQAKWLKVSERKTSTSIKPLSTNDNFSSRLRPRASMLTMDMLEGLSRPRASMVVNVDMLEGLPNLHCTVTTVEVI